MEQAQIENGKLVKDNKDNGMHITDAIRYYIDCVLNFERWQDYLRYYNKIWAQNQQYFHTIIDKITDIIW